MRLSAAQSSSALDITINETDLARSSGSYQRMPSPHGFRSALDPVCSTTARSVRTGHGRARTGQDVKLSGEVRGGWMGMGVGTGVCVAGGGREHAFPLLRRRRQTLSQVVDLPHTHAHTRTTTRHTHACARAHTQ
eukprot:650866-Rhodomonas_salina.1